MSLKPIPGEEEEDYDDEIEIEQPMLAPGDPMAEFLPTAFGRQEESRNIDALYEKTRRVPLKEKKKKKEPSSDDDSDDDDSDDDDEDEYPTSHDILIKAHEKPVSSLSLDPSGTRLVTASHDCSIKFFDFQSMSLDRLYAFRSIEPSESHFIHSATFSHLDSGRNVLVAPAHVQAKVYTRDGEQSVEFVKGDMYLRDMHNTKGHVAEITAGVWHPTDKNVVATASADSTIRIWDINSRRKHRDIIVHKSKTAKGGRSRMCSLAWTGAEGGKSLIASVALDGTLVVYAGEGTYSRPAMEVRNAHEPETWTGGIAFSGDGRLLVTRGQDRVIKLWDTRKMKTPVTTRTDFPVPIQSEANLIFNPSSTALLTGDATGNLQILSPATLRTEETIPLTPGSPVISVTWHQKLNQILTGSANGHLHMLFSPTASEKGAKSILANARRKRHIDDDPSMTTDQAAISGDAVILPNALLGGAGNAGHQLKKNDPRKPAMPQPTPWGKSQPDQAHIRNNIALSSMRDEDPREALLKYAEKAEKDPMFTGAWKETQPTTIYAEVGEEEEEEEPEAGDRKRRKW